MSKIEAIYRLYIRGYYSAEQALALGERKLSEEDYAILEQMISEEESRRHPQPEPQPEPEETEPESEEEPEPEEPVTESNESED